MGVIARLEWFEGDIHASLNLGPASLRSGAEPDEQAQMNLSPRTNHPAHPTCYLVRQPLVHGMSIYAIVALRPAIDVAFGSIPNTPSSSLHLEEV